MHGSGDSEDRISTKLYVGRVYTDISENDLKDLFDNEAKKISPLAKVCFRKFYRFSTFMSDMSLPFVIVTHFSHPLSL